MKKLLFTSLCLALCLSGYVHAAGTNSREKFYGKITAVNPSQKTLTVHNSKNNLDSQFEWSGETSVKLNKKEIQPMDLTIGQSVYVAYVTENDRKKATYIGVRNPFKKSQK